MCSAPALAAKAAADAEAEAEKAKHKKPLSSYFRFAGEQRPIMKTKYPVS